MQYLARQYEILFPRLPYLVRLALNLMLLPIILVWAMPRALWRLSKAHSPIGDAGIPVPEVEDGQFELDTKTRDEIAHEPAAMFRMRGLAGTEKWPAFLTQMARWDAVNASVEGQPLTYVGTRAARWAQLTFLEENDDCYGMAASELPLASIEKLEMAFAEHHRDPRLAAMLARAHEEMAWARRGGDYSDAVTADGWQGFEIHLERANEVLADFDVQQEASFLLASVTHTVALSSEWEDAACDAVFQRCLALNPRCWVTMRERAFHLLPRWGGDYERLEVAARQAMADTSELGAAAYAAFYLGVLDRDEGTLFYCDPALFAEGLADMATAEQDDQVFVNGLIEAVIGIVTPTASLFGGGGDVDINERRAAFGNAADALLKDHFHCHVTDVWTSAPQEVWNIVATAYAAELEAGCTIRLTHAGGAQITQPAPE
ncbi:hypothetical protein [uncultured Tateyamaria sp.]|uniref:hypothetical protein n=1 Tax=uncultured Tateyamaria sp. TaxID=455651 RepID=UPI002626CE2B|nr:hypothetical protein [uncultured Tateyamaria sp.]